MTLPLRYGGTNHQWAITESPFSSRSEKPLGLVSATRTSDIASTVRIEVQLSHLEGVVVLKMSFTVVQARSC